jgi:hypothetical protein
MISNSNTGIHHNIICINVIILSTLIILQQSNSESEQQLQKGFFRVYWKIQNDSGRWRCRYRLNHELRR